MLLAISITAAAMLAATVAQPSAQGAKQQAPKPASAKPVARTEYIKNIDGRFSAIDTNKDGSISASELQAMQSQTLERAAVVQQRRLDAQFNKLDTDKSGQLSLAEFRAAARGASAAVTPDQLLAKLDLNKNGKVELEEYRAPSLAQFDKADSNRDGSVSPAELRAARKR